MFCEISFAKKPIQLETVTVVGLVEEYVHLIVFPTLSATRKNIHVGLCLCVCVGILNNVFDW